MATQAGGGSEGSFRPAVIAMPTRASFNLPKTPSMNEILARLPQPNFASGSDAGSGDGNGSGTGDGDGGTPDIFGTKVDRDAIVHVDLNTWWVDDDKQSDGFLTSEDGKHQVRRFDDAVRSYLKQHFTHVVEYDSDVAACGFTMVYHPDLNLVNAHYPFHDPFHYHSGMRWGFNPHLRTYGYEHDIYATAYAAIGALTQPDVLIDPTQWYAPFGVSHGVPDGRPDVLVIASSNYEFNEPESTQDLIDVLRKRHIKLVLLTGGSAPLPILVDYARESRGSFSELTFSRYDDAVGKVKPAPPGLPYVKKGNTNAWDLSRAGDGP